MAGAVVFKDACLLISQEALTVLIGSCHVIDLYLFGHARISWAKQQPLCNQTCDEDEVPKKAKAV